jgi:hypothetical protein
MEGEEDTGMVITEEKVNKRNLKAGVKDSKVHIKFGNSL